MTHGTELDMIHDIRDIELTDTPLPPYTPTTASSKMTSPRCMTSPRASTSSSCSSSSNSPKRLSAMILASHATMKLKRMVSKKKRRFTQNGYDLDLTYVTHDIIAMGYPSSNIEGLFRNHVKDVVNFLTHRHENHYRLYNLCSERHYNIDIFHGNVSEYGFHDHHPPPMTMMESFCQDVHTTLMEHPENTVAVHCKAGKGRTGTMICAYLVYARRWHTAAGAMDYYSAARSQIFQGVTIPSQRRFIEYMEVCCTPPPDDMTRAQEASLTFDDHYVLWETQRLPPVDINTWFEKQKQVLHCMTLPPLRVVVMTKFRIYGLTSELPFIPFRVKINSGTHAYISPNYTPSIKEGIKNYVEFILPRPVIWEETHFGIHALRGNEKNDDKHLKMGKLKAGIWFHTSFLPPQKGQMFLNVEKKNVDKLCKDIKKGHRKVSAHFAIELIFEAVDPTVDLLPYHLQESDITRLDPPRPLSTREESIHFME